VVAASLPLHNRERLYVLGLVAIGILVTFSAFSKLSAWSVSHDAMDVLAVKVTVCLLAALALGPFTRFTRWMLVIAFVGFAIHNLKAIFAGETDCGCFGQHAVHPVITLSLNGVAMLTLLLGHPPLPVVANKRWARVFTRGASLALILIATQFATVLAESGTPPRYSDIGRYVGSGLWSKVLLLEPERWHGKPLPLVGEICSSEDLPNRFRDELCGPAEPAHLGVVFYNPGCRSCQKKLADTIERSRNQRDARLLVVALSEFHKDTTLSDLQARFPDIAVVRPKVDVRLILSKPVVLTIDQGAVSDIDFGDRLTIQQSVEG